MDIRKSVPLASYTTFKVGGPARYFCDIHSSLELEEAFAFARERHLAVFILGAGSNILISDEGFDGLVVHFADVTPDLLPNIESENDEKIVVGVSAGMNWDNFVQYAIGKNLYGVEHLSGIPGTVGGAVVANIGAYGAQVSDALVMAEVFDRKHEAFTKKFLTNEECAFAYHDSVFCKEPGRYVVTHATFALWKHATFAPQYRDNRFRVGGEGGDDSAETLLDVREKILSIREQKGALAMSGRTGFCSAGSFFHMPFVSKEEYLRVFARAQELDHKKEERLRPWAWLQPDGRYKLAPGFLLEYTQFEKGYRRGKVGISPRHTLTIINLGNATAREVARLAGDMEHSVTKLFGVLLEREVEYVGNVS
ncbi:MAG TPA: UDP-N-acetylmuramate dehydrogenase [Candidatus Paceibacterota bacterium]